ncbi:MAG: acyl carrier protein [Cryptosporangiaceae bacterium]|nr:acyl carrier protein [Cryptosporangiaceae bacterium]
MTTQVRQFVIDGLRTMNYDVDDVTDETPLAEGGIELESLGFAELAMMVEEQYGVRFEDSETEQMAEWTLGQFVAEVVGRAEPARIGG